MNFLKTKIADIPKHIWILLVIIFVGVFLRTYNFHDWLSFELDQVRDATIVGQVVSGRSPLPLLGPTMRASGDSQATLFRIGPVYYYFQIISAKIFGNYPDKMAYPDLFFAVFSIPLFYYFLRKYFNVNISLFLTALYSVSFFAIKYSRFAWNPNSIPFFVILFLLSLHEFIVKKEKTSWLWVIAAGLAIGIGIQLHALLFLIMGLMSTLVVIHLLKKNLQIWKKIFVVLALVVFMNIPQIISEFHTGFANSKLLLNSPVRSGESQKKSLFSIVADDLSCHIEAGEYLLSSLGQESCNFAYIKTWENNKAGAAFRTNAFWPEIFAVFLFSIVGYFLLAYRFHREEDDSKKYFLGLNILFLTIFFIVMIPVIGSNFKEFRYFSPIFFIPYVVLGLIMKFLIEKKSKIYWIAGIFLGTFFVAANVVSLYAISLRFIDHRGNNGHSVILGEVEDLVGYMRDISGNQKEIYFMGDKVYSSNIFLPGEYVANKYGYKLIKAPSPDNVPRGAALFFVAQNRGDDFDSEIEGLGVKSVENFGEMRIYQLEN